MGTEQAWDKLYPDILARLVSEGDKYDSRTDMVVETLGSQFCLEEPRTRPLINPGRRFNVFQGIGQWIWIISGRMDLNFISYYSDDASKFTTDGFRMHGAYGPRISGIGVYNQIEQVIKTIKNNKQTRRALIPVFVPSFDNYPDRYSEDHEDEIPCPVAFHLLPRGGSLEFITYMRSQNAYKLLPLDVFIFTLIHEYVAARTGMDLGNYFHYSGSLHYNITDEELVSQVIDTADSVRSEKMRSIPHEEPKSQLEETIKFEQRLRNQVHSVIQEKCQLPTEELIEEVEQFPAFWSEINMSLLFWGEFRVQEQEGIPNTDQLEEIIVELGHPFDIYAERKLEHL